MSKFHSYDTAWNRNGLTDLAQYSGQVPVQFVFTCPCGAEGREYKAGPTERMWCANKHEMSKVAVH